MGGSVSSARTMWWAVERATAWVSSMTGRTIHIVITVNPINMKAQREIHFILVLTPFILVHGTNWRK